MQKDPMSAADHVDTALDYLAEVDSRAGQPEITVPDLTAFAQVFATLAVAGRLEELTAAVRSIDGELANIRTVLENISL
jgi:hypothetical protein